MPNRNGIQHEEIIDKLRFGLPFLLENKVDELLCIADEGLMALFCNSGNGKGERPDLIIQCNNERFLIEVGDLNKSKWELSDVNLIHVSHNKAVGLIQGSRSETAKLVLESVRNSLDVI